MSDSRTLGSLLECLIDYRGKTPPKAPSGVRLVTAKVIKDGRIEDHKAEFISEDTYKSWMSRGFPQRGDILITTEAPLGQVAQLRSSDRVALAQRVILLRADPLQVDPQYLFHYLRSPLAQQRLRQRASGTTVSGIRQPELRAVEVPTPPLFHQRRIGVILDAFDDLIENNRRRITLLEQMVHAIYRQWFVHFRYPGHANDDLVDSNLGRVPAGWDVMPVAEAVEINPRVRGTRGDEVPFVAMADLSNDLMVVRPNGSRTFGGGGSRFQQHDTLFARITPCIENGKTGFVQFLGPGEVATGSTEFIVFRARRFSAYSTYCLARRDDLRRHAIASMAGASGRQRVRNECFQSFVIAASPTSLQQLFAAAVEPIFRSCDSLAEQGQRLTSLRDVLLPKLVTGAIDVSELDLDALIDQPAV